MGKNRVSLLLSCLCFISLLWPQAQSVSITKQVSTGDITSAGQGKQRPRVEKRFAHGCDTSFDNFCLNNGQCMFVADLNTNTCKCELGFQGSRCEEPQLVTKPVADEQVALIIVCVALLIIGLAGTLYFCCKWYRRSQVPQQQKRRGYTGVQTA